MREAHISSTWSQNDTCDDSPTGGTRFTRAQSVSGTPLLHRNVLAIVDTQIYTSGTAWSTRNAFLGETRKKVVVRATADEI